MKFLFYTLIMESAIQKIKTSQWQSLPQDTKRPDWSHLGVFCLFADSCLWCLSLSPPGSCCRFSLTPGHSRSTRLLYAQQPAALALLSVGCCTKTDKYKVSINVNKHNMKIQRTLKTWVLVFFYGRNVQSLGMITNMHTHESEWNLRMNVFRDKSWLINNFLSKMFSKFTKMCKNN